MNHGIDYLLAQQMENGLVVSIDPVGRRSELMYSHSIATLLLAEVSGMLDAERQKSVDRVLPRALLVLLQAQKVPKPNTHAGGWRYAPGSIDSDLSLPDGRSWRYVRLVKTVQQYRTNTLAMPSNTFSSVVEGTVPLDTCQALDGHTIHDRFGYTMLGTVW